MLENRYKKNSESNILTSIILVMLMVLSTTIAMMIPTEWDEPEATVDVAVQVIVPSFVSLNANPVHSLSVKYIEVPLGISTKATKAASSPPSALYAMKAISPADND